jgi:hypothetical protein
MHNILPVLWVVYLPLVIALGAILFLGLCLSVLSIPSLVLIHVLGVGMWKSILIPIAAIIVSWIIGVVIIMALEDNKVAWWVALEKKANDWHKTLLEARPMNRRELRANFKVD